MLNWNNRVARDFQAADSEWGYSSVMRDELLVHGLTRHRMYNLATLTGVMNRAATQDVREAELLSTLVRILKTGPAPNARDARILQLLRIWRGEGSSRLDRDGNGTIDAPGAAAIDYVYHPMVEAALKPVLGTTLEQQLATLIPEFEPPPVRQFNGWMGYVDKDLRTLLGDHVKGWYSIHYCGRGNLVKCRHDLWAAFDAGANHAQAALGPNPDKWHADATAEQIHFLPVNLLTMRYTNRPTGIQQVITFTGHR